MTTSALFWFWFHELNNCMQKGWLCSLAYILSWAPGSLRAEWDSKRTCKAERLPAFFQLPFIFPSWCLKSCYLHRPALKGPTEMCKKFLAFVFPCLCGGELLVWHQHATNIMEFSLVETLLSGFHAEKGNSELSKLFHKFARKQNWVKFGYLWV